jgi:glutathione S-transferase
LPYARDAQLPLNEFRDVRRWYDQIDAIEAWRNPFPAR